MAGKNIFNSIKLTRPNKNVFDLSHDVKLSFNMGQLVPIMCTEAVPGDKFNISCESLLRFQPLVSPVMHRMDVTMHYFFVPNRILYAQWENFITGTNALAFPTISIGEDNYTPLMDYFGIPRPPAGTVNREIVSAFPFAAYQKIYNEYYRDQNLQTEIPTDLVSGDNGGNSLLFDLRLRAWEHDYFTSALPFAQKGSPVEMPINGVVQLDNNASPNPGLIRNAGGQGILAGTHELGVDDNVQTGSLVVEPNTTADQVVYDPNGTLVVNSAGTTINELRRAFRLQEWLEKNARGGTRYIESILSHFGVKSSDKRLQRPEYITGTKSPVVISEVLATADDGTNPLGTQAGHAISVTQGKYGNYRVEEHGYIIGIMSVMPKTAYQQGIPKHFLKTSDPFQYYWPSFAHIGEQPVENRELYAYQGAASDDTFGYVPRYAEYKFENSRVAGDFRTTLDYWHLGRIFATPPALNSDFIEMNPTAADRIFAVTDPAEQKMLAHVFNKIRAVRPMPKFGTPTF